VVSLAVAATVVIGLVKASLFFLDKLLA
jgi:hypothetical protein